MPDPTARPVPALNSSPPPETVTNVLAPDPAATATFAVGPVGPYLDATPHARGGLGEVFRATDPALHRTVAVKRLQAQRAQDAGSRRRFLLEAEVTARLEHPGVVPVYALYPDGETGPAYAMRFVDGPTLADAIAQYHTAAPEPLAFRRLLLSFLQVCQAVAYAHSRGVIHRDLKPQNVVLGKFGETLVLDWGLAKVVGRPDDLRTDQMSEVTLVPGASAIDADSSETQMGSAVGTPAYMSPEQAAGRWDVVAQASDVYGLGAVLYTVLTGKPPQERGNWPEMQQKIQRGDFPLPRQVKPDVPRPLEAVCLKAMAVKSDDRYSSAAALGTEVEHWLADEPVMAFPERLPTRARRWAKRNRTAVSAAAVLLIVAVIGLSIGAALLQRARVETDQQRTAAVASQRKAEAINRFLVDDLLKQADPVNNPIGVKLTVRELLDKAADKLDAQTNLAEQPEIEAEVRTVIGHAYEYLSVLDKCERHYRRAWELRTRLIGPDHLDTLTVRNRLIWAIANQSGRPEAEMLAQAAMDDCIRVLGDTHVQTGEASSNLAEVYSDGGKFDAAVSLRREASRILNANLGPNDEKTLTIDNDLAVSLVRAGKPFDAVPLFQSVIDRYRTINPRHPDAVTSRSNLGAALNALGRFAEAEKPLREAIDLSNDTVGAKHQTTLSTRNNLCSALEGQSRWREAETSYLTVLADRRWVGLQEPSEKFIMRTVGCMARLYAKQGRWPDASKYLAELILVQNPDPKRTVDEFTVTLSSALTGKADPATVKPLLSECWEVLKVRMWAGDWLTAEVASRYGDCLRRQKNYVAAEPILIAAASDVAKAVGVPEWGVAAARKRVADLYDAWQKPDEAAKWR